MTTATVLTDGGNQAVNLPKDMQFKGVTEVEATRAGESVVLTPIRRPQTHAKTPNIHDTPAPADAADDFGRLLARITPENLHGEVSL